MRVSAFTISLRAIGPGAAWATTVRASLVSSEARSTASGRAKCSSWPSTEASHRRTLRTISSWVSPSKLSCTTAPGYRRRVRGTGTIVNVLSVLAGSFAGLLAGTHLTERIRTTLLQGIGLVVLVIGVADAGMSRNITFPLVSIVLGGAIGELIGVEERLNGLAERVQRLARRTSESSTFVDGFVTTSLLFCVGPLTILGSIQD